MDKSQGIRNTLFGLGGAWVFWPRSISPSLAPDWTASLLVLALQALVVAVWASSPGQPRFRPVHWVWRRTTLPWSLGLAAGLWVLNLGLVAGTRWLQPVPLPHLPLPPWSWWGTAPLLLGAAVREEVFFRWFLLETSRLIRWPAWMALVGQALVFGLCHLNQGPLGVLQALLSGLALGAVYLRTRSLTVVSLGHAAYNLSVSLV